MAYKQEIENIVSRLESAGVEISEQEKQQLGDKLSLLIDEWKVPPAEAVRTVTQASLKAHGIETKYWQTGGTAPLVTVDQVKADNEWLSLKATVVQIWENRSDKVALTGLIGDGTGVIKFTVFTKNSDIIPADFNEGKTYRFDNMVSSVWNGQFSVKGNKNSSITPIDEEIGVGRKAETLTGVITSILSGSGLIKRCPECNRALAKGSCGEHGRVDGLYDLRIKAVFIPLGTNDQIDLIVGTEATEALAGMTVQAAKEIAAEALDITSIADMFRKKFVGRYYEVTGSMMQSDTMLVSSIEPANAGMCTPAVLSDALAEIKGGN